MTDQQHEQGHILERFKRQLHETHGDVEHIQTHISHVLLAGDRAYKIKKPVNFGFLNFADKADRLRFCLEEMRLNRRLAPALYEEVFGLDTEGRPVAADERAHEYVIRMRRFEQGNRLDNHASDKGLDDHRIDEIAAQIAEFHAEAHHAPADSRFGTPETVYAPIGQNFDQIRPFLEAEGNDEDEVRLDRIQAATEAAFEKVRPLLEQRKTLGHIREGHGDMHLANIALIDDQITIFDGIEFNDDFRWIDTANDLAFLLMDLADRKLIGAARRLLNAYLEVSGDYEALPLLMFYQAYRAMVRAKIALLGLRPDLTDTERAEAWATYRRYAELAESMLAPRKGMLWITMGFSGSGKSLAALEVVLAQGAIRVRSDAERLRMFTDPAQRYAPEATEETYKRLQDIARIGIEAGWPMAIDATFLQHARRQPFIDLADQLGVPAYILFIECDAPTLRRYLRERQNKGKDISEADEQVLEAQMQQLEPLNVDEQKRTFRLRCDSLFGAQVSEILSAL